MSARNLVIVESPAKAKTIGKYLGDDFTVAASVGHIRDLPLPKELPADMKKGPYGRFAVNVEEGFEPYYVVNPDKKKTVSELKKLLKEADALYLATDEDREGEAIAWHLLEALKPKKSLPVYRMVFHEITKEAIQKALTETRELDMPLVDAQETRRILDRLVGYELSPVLWRKVRRGTSAGRVQSVATRLVVDRERERMAFKAASYWDVTGEFITSELEDRSVDTPAFTAQLRTLDGQRVATGRDFTDAGELKKSLRANVTVLTEESARLLIEALDGAKATVGNLESKPYTRRPAAPFTTSSLQQEASRKLRMGARHTMSTAQRLYENGYITYMRTDSVVLSGEAIRASRAQIQEMYGAEYVPDRPRVYTNKSQGAQEAHEAIRPAGSNFRTPAQVSRQLSGDEFRLYELIWKRTVASQMADAKGTTTSVTLDVEGKGRTAQFGASGTIITFRGFLAAYEEGRDQSRYAEHDDKDKRLPQMKEGQQLTAAQYTPNGHETTPPPRYTEASLVRALEERGIGRPSTYAATISVIQDRGYVEKKGSALVPSWLAFSVVKLLEEHFGTLVDYEFTADMEAGLDRIAAGNTDRVHWLSDFYYGKSGSFDTPAEDGLKATLDNLGDIDARAINTVPIGNGIDLRMGQYGPYIERAVEGSDTPQRANVPADLAPDELTLEKAEELMARAKDDGRVLGRDPDSGFEILAKDGRYGPYVTENLELDEATKALPKTKQPKPRTASLFKDMDLATVTLEDALKLLSLPRVVGKDAEGVEITAQNGRYGPYLKKGTDSRSLETEAQLFTITEEEALALYAQPKRRGRAAAKPPIAELGVDPTSEKPIVIKDGRFGMYITDGTTNVTLRKDESPETMTHERAVERLAEKRAKGPAKRKTTRKSSSRAKSTKK
ncbi:DNA topoisomerase I [Dermabacter sp. HFH0086]|uniref:type I DNA topoisomerase n=1 Tax=Dermabacter TaxID=36739 RepID=UPI0003548467|nr:MULTISPECIES: type I DNA topoisomerase [Dermabacter]EPH17663.1 DNA topoisomerase I [Dermabacter sp. HFH0086]MDU4923572.1 type I DNA topoisomerase [Dermabacter sp.]